MAKHNSHIVLLTLAVSITASLAAPFRIAARSRDIQERDQTLEELYAHKVDGYASLFKRSGKGNRLSTIPEDDLSPLTAKPVFILPKGSPSKGRPSSPPPKMRKTEEIPDVPPLPAQFQHQNNNAKVIQSGTSAQPKPRPDPVAISLPHEPEHAQRQRLQLAPPTPPPPGGLPRVPIITRDGRQVPANSPYSPPDRAVPALPISRFSGHEFPVEPLPRPSSLKQLIKKISIPNLRGPKSPKSPTSPPHSPTSPKSATSGRKALKKIFSKPGNLDSEDLHRRDVHDDEEFFVRHVHDEDENMFARDEEEFFAREFDLDELD